jgi:hypothetical protein
VLVPRRLALLLPALLLTPPLAGCGTFAQSSAPAGVDGLTIPTPSPAPSDYVGTVDNPWLALTSTTTRTYDVSRPGQPETTRVVEVLPGRVRVAGVATTAVRSTVGDQVSTDLFAQDTSGNVWWFGHDGPDRPWRAGAGGAQAGLAMAAAPRVGDGYRTAYVPEVVEDVATVVKVAKGTVQVDVTSRLEPGSVTRESYARGTGLTLRADAGTGGVEQLRQ